MQSCHRSFAGRSGGLLLASVSFAAVLNAQGEPPPAPPDPWRMQHALGDPSWLKISGEVRLRYEGIDGQFRNVGRLDSSDQLLFQRTLLRADADLAPLGLTLEIIDARQYAGGSGSAVSLNSVDALDLLQGYGEFDLGRLGSGQHRLRAGRQTIDLGSRRLVARNRFRNTINAFTGIDWKWQGETAAVEAFWVLPVLRRPFDLDSVLDNQIELDTEDVDRQFAGVFHEQKLPGEHVLELYGFFLWEEDLLQRRLVTPGVRFRRDRSRGRLDYQYEFAYQFGRSRLASDLTRELDHSAWFQHASAGYTFDADCSPRIGAAFDHASGDRDPDDGDNGRFDTLFGARRFEYGPTGIYGAVARANLISPELRFTCKPSTRTDVGLAWRGIWLASERDAWLAANVRDPSGQSGRHVGQQLETRLRWDPLPGNLRLEVGGAYLFGGRFQRDAPGGQGTDTAYGFLEATLTF